jgi:hypothetical protein
MAKPIFVLGATASGTELLRLALNGHPDISIGPETAIMRLVKAHRYVPYWRFGRRWWERLDLTEEDLNLALRDFYGGFFEHIARTRGKRRWGEKTPLHVWHIDEIAAVFDDAVFVALVRDPNATTASLVARFEFDAALATTTWLRMNQVLVHDGAKLGERLVLLRYEELVHEPEPVLRELLEWLGEPWSPAVLEQFESREPDRAAHHALTQGELDSVRTRTRDWARFFGYGDDRLVPASSRHRYLLTGSQLAERRDAFAEELDLRRPPRPPHEGVFKPPPRRYATRGQSTSVLASLRERLPLQLRQTAGRIRDRVQAQLSRRS